MPRIAEQDLYLGYSPRDLAETPYAPFWRPEVKPLIEPVREALAVGGVAHALTHPVSEARQLLRPGYQAVETGFTQCPDGSARVNVLTPMPGVTPAMWDWWFGWHGSEALRYKLWHPRAHVHAVWEDGRSDLAHYVGRTSHVVEYVGAQRMALTIRFVTPASLGLDEARLAAQGEVAICARGGIAGTPMETGWLVHHLRPTADGAEMRSRFWIAGDNIRPRGMGGQTGRLIGGLAAKLVRPGAVEAADLLVHCAQEMGHLAAILPQLYSTFGPGAGQ
jgi:hypothetical protein